MKSFKTDWSEIDSLESEGLIRSALDKVNELVLILPKENTAQKIKSALYQSKFIAQLEENGFEKLLLRIEAESDQSVGIEQAIYQSILGELYYLYFQRNLYRIRDRTPGEDEQGDHLLSWSPKQFIDRSNELFLRSVQSNKFERNDIALIDDLIFNYADIDRRLCTDVGEFLRIRALHHFVNRHALIAEPVEIFVFNGSEAFADLAGFLKLDYSDSSNPSFTYRALRAFQDLIHDYELKKNDYGVAYFNLERLKFAWRNSVHEDKFDLFESALDASNDEYKSTSVWPLYRYELANLYYEQGLVYGQDFDVQYKTYLKRAFQLLKFGPKETSSNAYQPLVDQLLTKIMAVQLEVDIEQVVLPGKDFLMYVRFRNVEIAHFKIIRLEPDDSKYLENSNRKDRWTHLMKMPALMTWSHNFQNTDFNFHATELPVDKLPLGHYIIMASNHPDFSDDGWITSYNSFHVSQIAYDISSGHGSPSVIVRDRETGQPLSGAKVETYSREYDITSRKNIRRKTNEYTSDDMGLARFESGYSGNMSIRISLGSDILDLDQFHYIATGRSEDASHTSGLIFTDRNIYRPGQNIYFKILALQYERSNLPRTLVNEDIHVRLKDVNGQEVSYRKLRTQSFGSANSVLLAPSNGLTGQFQIEIELRGIRMYKSVRIEEYKRPTFEAQVLPPENSFQLRDTVSVEINAQMFAGVPLSDATVNYRVVRQGFIPYFQYRKYSFPPFLRAEKEIAYGQSRLDAQGQYRLSFFLLPDERISREMNPRFHYTVYADVTDITGETHSGTTRLTASYDPFMLEMGMEEQINLDLQNNIKLSAYNSANKSVSIKGKIEWQKLEGPEYFKREKQWGKQDTFAIGKEEYEQRFPLENYGDQISPEFLDFDGLSVLQNFDHGTAQLQPPGNLQAGQYRVNLAAEDENGKTAELVRYVSMYSFEEEDFPFTQAMYLSIDERDYSPGDTVELQLGTALKAHSILVEVQKMGEIAARNWIDTKTTANFAIPVSENDRGDFYIHITHYYHNTYTFHTETISVPWSNKDLKLEWKTFRNKVKPGSDEVWQFTLHGPENEPVIAEAVLSMYDASLDQFSGKNSWRGSIFRLNPNKHYRQIPGFGHIHLIRLDNFSNRIPNSFRDPHILPMFNWFNIDKIFGSMIVAYASEDAMLKRNNIPSSLDSEEMELTIQAANLESEIRGLPSGKPANILGEISEVGHGIRKNFKETVFFIPEIKSDPEGNIVFSFKMNDALTRWRLQGFAHTKDLQHTFFEKLIVSQKEIMATPVPPRFLRAGDVIYFPVKFSNLSDIRQNCRIDFQILDAKTGKSIADFLADDQTRNLALDPGESVSLNWKINVPRDFQGLVKYKVSARADQHSDIVEDFLPVLTNRKLVTQTLAFDVQPGETRQLRFDHFLSQASNTLVNHQYTLEFTTHPIWIVIQALPFLLEKEEDCSEAILNRLFANALAAHIVKLNPVIENVFREWKDHTPEALLSELQKNEDLKSSLLKETPWLLDAKSEEEQRRQIALLFDLNNIRQDYENSLEKLAGMQLPNGGFPWFRGGRDNRSITQYILAGLGRMKQYGLLHIGNENPSLGTMMDKSIEYIDERFLEDYQNFDKQDDKVIGYLDLHYLYMRSFFPEYVNQKLANEQNHMEALIRVNWTDKSIMGQAMSAIVLHRKGDPYAQTMKESLSERALRDEELGVYWKSGPGYGFFDLPIEGHAKMISLYNEMGADAGWVDQMKLWLIKHKQTNQWPTGKSTAEAVFAFIADSGSEAPNIELSAQADEPVISVGKRRLNITAGEAGTGYFRLNWHENQIDKELGAIEITNPNNHLSWGAVYWQYFEDLDAIEGAELNSLKIKKTIFEEVNTDSGPSRIRVENGQSLQPGDKLLIRLEISSDREMDFVHLKDMRAAGLEPVNVLSGYRWQGGVGYYESTEDMATNFFFDHLPKGTLILEYPLRVLHNGEFSMGISSIQSYYAPEFGSHSKGIKLTVNPDL